MLAKKKAFGRRKELFSPAASDDARQCQQRDRAPFLTIWAATSRFKIPNGGRLANSMRAAPFC